MTRLTRSRARISALTLAVALGATGYVMVAATPSAAASPSDVRANFVAGNAVTCAQVGFPASKIAFADNDDPISQDGITGSVSAHSGGGQEANIVTPIPAGITIQAVVMKGGPAYNVYSTNSGTPPGNHVPDTEVFQQHYISPLNGGGNVPAVSHWFVCYTGGETPPPPPPGTGSLLVTKVVEGPVSVPSSFTASVQCDDGTDETVTLPGEGGDAIEGPVTGITAGSFCIVTETSFVSLGKTLIDGITVSPPEAMGPDGVEVDEDTEVTVTITNAMVRIAPEDLGFTG